MNRWQIILCGSGGQGLGLAGKILATAALYDGLYVAQSQSYGARVRGGYSASGVVLNDREINFPLIEKPNLLLALTRKAYYKNAAPGQDAEHIVFDSERLVLEPGPEKYGFPLTSLARAAGNPKGLAILALGVLTALFELVTPASMEKAIAANMDQSWLESNLLCYRQGWVTGQRSVGQQSNDRRSHYG